MCLVEDGAILKCEATPIAFCPQGKTDPFQNGRIAIMSIADVTSVRKYLAFEVRSRLPQPQQRRWSE